VLRSTAARAAVDGCPETVTATVSRRATRPRCADCCPSTDPAMRHYEREYSNATASRPRYTLRTKRDPPRPAPRSREGLDGSICSCVASHFILETVPTPLMPLASHGRGAATSRRLDVRICRNEPPLALLRACLPSHHHLSASSCPHRRGCTGSATPRRSTHAKRSPTPLAPMASASRPRPSPRRGRVRSLQTASLEPDARFS
jgi:hypothetical protein